MVSWVGTRSVALLLVATAVAGETTRNLQQDEVVAVPVAVCQGGELNRVANGCISPEDCMATAVSLGLTIGSDQFGFAGDWDPRGCYYYPSDHPTFPNQAFYGLSGSCTQLSEIPLDGAVRIDCAQGTTIVNPINDFDASTCGSVCLDMDECLAAAQASGLQIGGAYPFDGDWDVKGCHYYPSEDPSYSLQAYWGSGATSCEELSGDPTDGSLRLGCSSVPVQQMTDEPMTPAPTSEGTAMPTVASTTSLPGTAMPSTNPVVSPEDLIDIVPYPAPNNLTDDTGVNATFGNGTGAFYADGDVEIGRSDGVLSAFEGEIISSAFAGFRSDTAATIAFALLATVSWFW